MKKELVDYIQSGIEKGYSSVSLKAILTSHGWEEKEVEEAVSAVEGDHSPDKESHPELPMREIKEKKPALLKIVCLFGFFLSLLLAITGILFLFPNFVDYLSRALPTIGGLIGSVIVPESGIFAIVPYIFSIVIGIVGFIGFVLLWKMEKAGMFLVLVAGLASIVNDLIDFSILRLINVAVWALVLVYVIISRKNFN
ncbi:hypothetical protein COV15_02730 [Candidatus Woesearchaeota archaeon CG10_big_fil_rev_8_21_14_0_10_34_12]|nr:MAG: hypothetical protein COV15_02730 [Candidatus Woesearchaeota archaeon CG10_big_fil_rev_8_21_14_0_10_34_12]